MEAIFIWVKAVAKCDGKLRKVALHLQHNSVGARSRVQLIVLLRDVTPPESVGGIVC